MATVAKTLRYRRVIWFSKLNKGESLERFVRMACDELPYQNDRRIHRALGQYLQITETASAGKGAAGFFVHLTADTPGDQASMVAKAPPHTATAKVGTASPPDGNEWMDGDAALLVDGDNVLVCSTGISDAAIRGYLYDLFEKAKLPQHTTQFDISNVPKIDILKLIKSKGVKEIDLGATLYDATINYENRKSPGNNFINAVKNHAKALFGDDDKLDKQKTLSVRVALKFDRRKKHGEFGRAAIEDAARKLVQDKNDDFTIITSDNQRITPDDVSLKKSIQMSRSGKSVFYRDAWKGLEDYHKQLKSSGLLAQ